MPSNKKKPNATETSARAVLAVSHLKPADMVGITRERIPVIMASAGWGGAADVQKVVGYWSTAADDLEKDGLQVEKLRLEYEAAIATRSQGVSSWKRATANVLVPPTKLVIETKNTSTSARKELPARTIRLSLVA